VSGVRRECERELVEVYYMGGGEARCVAWLASRGYVNACSGSCVVYMHFSSEVFVMIPQYNSFPFDVFLFSISN
jgi:hypothetical protein